MAINPIEMKTRCRFFVFFCCLCSFGRPAWAYILPTEWLLRSMIEHQHLQTVKDMALSFKYMKAPGTEVLSQKVYMKRPERARVVIFSRPPVTSILREEHYALHEKETWEVSAPKIPNMLPFFYFPKGQNTDEKVARIKSILKKYGIDVERVSLGRQDRRIVYIIGAQSWETTKPQLWLDKLTYQPQRLLVMITKAQEPSHVVETLFKSYGDIAGFPSMPKYIHISVDGQQADQMELLQVKVNQNIPESYFQWKKNNS
jgi:outer membrane lipoprotein-sorting protein